MNKREVIQNNIVKAIQEDSNKVLGIHVSMRLGKTKALINYFKTLKNKPKILISYPDNKIKESWELEMEKWDYKNENITFCNFSSLKKYINENYDILVIDECQFLSDFELEQVVLLKDKCSKILMPSGTISQKTYERLSIYLGMVITYEYSVESAIDDKIIADYQITVHYVKLDTRIKTKAKNGVMRSEKNHYDAYSAVIENLKRQKKDFMFLSLQRNRISQNSISKISYVKDLLKQMKDKRVLVFNGLAKVADSLGIDSYHSKVSDTGFKKFQHKVINHLALVNMAKSGVTFNYLDSIILNGFTHNESELSQVIARAQIMDFNNKVADIHIICLTEPAEVKKLQNALKMMNLSKVKYIESK